ncbi:MAG: elongation factor G [bacterium]|nr:elongation factor G [bacterium]
MSQVAVNQKRNIAVVGHHGCGKTSLIEAILYHTGVIDRLGRINDGNTFADYLDDEKSKKHTLSSKVFECDFKGCDLQFIDTPGYSDFVGDIKGALHAADGALLVINAQSGIEVETEKIWEYIMEMGIPRLAVVNRMDCEHADFQKCLDQLEGLGAKVCPVRLPLGAAGEFKGIIDLITDKVQISNDKGGVAKEEDIPGDIHDWVEEYRQKTIEAAVETDEALMERYFNDEKIEFDEIRHGLHDCALTGSTVPILVTDAYHCVGIESLLDGLVNYIPTPLDRKTFKAVKKGSDETFDAPVTEDGPGIGFVFKSLIDPFVGKISFIRVESGVFKSESEWHNRTKGGKVRVGNMVLVNGKKHTSIQSASTGDIIAVTKVDAFETNDTVSTEAGDVLIEATHYPQPQVYMALRIADKNDEDKVNGLIPKLISGDPTLHFERNFETKEYVISAAGQMQIDLIMERVKQQTKVSVELATPRVAYRETISAQGEGMYRHKKQSGGRGQFAEVHLRLRPLERGKDYEFINSIFGGAIPTKFVPAVEKGIDDARTRGIAAGYPVVDISVEVFDGKYHDVDSSEMAFKIASSMCVRKVASEKCKPIILEPIMSVNVTIPEDYMGDVMGDLNSRRGRVQGMDPGEGKQIIHAQVPLAEMFTYAIDLRSITQGRGTFEMEPSHYEPVPSDVMQKIVAENKMEISDEE